MPAPLVMQATKPAGVCRIFIFGESAALGDPRPHFSASRYLEALLRERFPGREFEVINTSVTAINSHVILPIARECAAHQGDIWIIYMGNNEMVGPFGAATVFGRKAPPLGFVRLTLAIQRTRLGQLIVDLGRRLHKPATGPSWHGLEMFLENKVPPNDPRREVVYASFARNLDDIVQAGLRSGAKILLSSVAVNLKDCPPFASESGGQAGADAAAVESLCAEAAQAETNADFAQAARAWQQALRVSPQAAEPLFRLAHCHLRLTNLAAARECFSKAVDRDALPFRADLRINAAVAQAARRFASLSVAFCDAAAILATNNPAGVSGIESFYEHVHLNFDGNYRLARAWADQIEKLLPPVPGSSVGAPPSNTPSAWASQETCERMLGLTDWNRVSVFEEIGGRLELPPFSGQTGNARRLEAIQATVAELRRRIAAASPAQAREVYLAALKRAPDDYALHENFAEFLEATHDLAQATTERRKVCELIPHNFFPYYSLGQLLKEQGQLAEAVSYLQKAVALNPHDSETRLKLGMAYARQSRWEASLRELELARQFSPEDAHVFLYLGEVLWKLKRPAESLDRLREAVRLQPDYLEAHYRLGETLGLQGQPAAAAAEFEQVLRINPAYIKARMNLGVALVQLGRPREAVVQFDTVLQLDPQNKQAAEFKRRVAGQ